MRAAGGRRLAMAVSACLIALVPACSGSGVHADEPAPAAVPAEFAATFDVGSPLGLVAGDGQAWVLAQDGSGASLSRVDHAGRLTHVARLPGRAHDMAPYRDGVVVARTACVAEDCEETAAQLLVLDATGSTVAEQEYARQAGGLESSSGVVLIGVHGDVVWIDTADGLIGHDLATGRTAARLPSPPGVTCVFADGIHTLVSLDGQYFGHGGVMTPGAPVPQFEAEVHRLAGTTWTPVPGSRRLLTDEQMELATCAGGGVRAGVPIAGSPVWSSASGWVDRGPYLRAPAPELAPEPVAFGQGDQLFVLEGAGVVRRWFAGPDGPMSAEPLQVPADIFVQPYGPALNLLVDRGSSLLVGCIGELGGPPARCWLSSAGA